MAENEEKIPDQEPSYRKLYRSNTQKVLAGVCGGVAEYFNVDVNIVRILWLVSVLLGGSGLLAYIICWIVIPPQGSNVTSSGSAGSASIIIGIVLIFLGIGMFFYGTGWGCWSVFGWHGWPMLPIFVLVLVGGVLLGVAITKGKTTISPAASIESAEDKKEGTKQVPPRPKRIHRSRTHRIIGGVCGGIGEYFNLDPTIVRIIWLLVSIGSEGGGLVVYIILMLVIPDEPY